MLKAIGLREQSPSTALRTSPLGWIRSPVGALLFQREGSASRFLFELLQSIRRHD
jgi:hypothetical protein